VTAYGYLDQPPGNFELTINLDSSTYCSVEVWDPISNSLLLRRNVPPTNKRISLTFKGVSTKTVIPQAYSGFATFRILPIEPLPLNQIEVRVWEPTGGKVTVYSYNVS
jgi:hypothetical protein